MSLDYVIIDEAKFIDYEQLKDETFQANRGNQMYFGNFYMHHGLTITSDMPVTKKGSWFLNYKKQMDNELVQVIEGLVYYIWTLKKKVNRYPDKAEALHKKIEALTAQLNKLRSQCLLYKEYTSIENLALLGEDFIRRAKRDLPPLTFATSIMCQHIGISADGFYSGLRSDFNYYTAPNYSNLNLANVGNVTEDSRLDKDCDPNLPLCIAFDANANINWLVVGQVDKTGKLRVLKSFLLSMSVSSRSYWMISLRTTLIIAVSRLSFITMRPLSVTTMRCTTMTFTNILNVGLKVLNGLSGLSISANRCGTLKRIF